MGGGAARGVKLFDDTKTYVDRLDVIDVRVEVSGRRRVYV